MLHFGQQLVYYVYILSNAILYARRTSPTYDVNNMAENSRS